MMQRWWGVAGRKQCCTDGGCLSLLDTRAKSDAGRKGFICLAVLRPASGKPRQEPGNRKLEAGPETVAMD